MLKLDAKIYVPAEFAPDTEKISQTFDRVSDRKLRKLEILVRETIQNSLDAALPIKSPEEPGNVEIHFRTGEFSADSFSGFLPEGFDKEFLDYAEKNCNRRFFSIRDSNCTGLTGYVNRKLAQRVDGKWPPSNFNRLVFGYMNGKSVAEVGAGGSFGVGKTILFNFGAGLVVYYSKTLAEGSRLIIAYLEDAGNRVFSRENVPDGAAWFGRNKTVEGAGDILFPIEDEKEIASVLSCFGLEPYGENETGTTAIVPFWDPGQIQSSSSEDELPIFRPPWEISERDFVRYAVLKWYAPRLRGDCALFGNASVKKEYRWGLCNHHGISIETCGRGLAVRYNGFDISPYSITPGSGVVSEYPLFSLMRELYDSAAYSDARLTADDYKFEVSINNSRERGVYFEARGVVGWVVVRKINLSSPTYRDSRAVLDSLCPANLSASGKGVFVYCRRPGMLVSYSSDWAERVYAKASLKQDERLIGIFVANSACGVCGDQNLLLRRTCVEELFRDREGVEHNGWGVDGKQKFWPGVEGNFVSRVVSAIEKKISAQYSEKISPNLGGELPAVSRYIGSLLNLQKGPGNGSGGNNPYSTGGPGQKKGKDGNHNAGRRNAHSAIAILSPRYEIEEGMTRVLVPLKVRPIKGKFECEFALNVNTDAGSFDKAKWEDDFPGEPYPVILKAFGLHEQANGVSCKIEHNRACFVVIADFKNEEEVQFDLSYVLNSGRKVSVEIKDKIITDGGMK